MRKGLYPQKGTRGGSVKGAAVHYGMKKILSVTDHNACHFILDADSDLSVHPQLLGLLLEKAISTDAAAVIGSRRQPDSVALIEKKRDTRGRLYNAISQRLLPSIFKAGILDTNRGFKLYSFQAAKEIVEKQTIFGIPYQIESMLIAMKKMPEHVIPQGISYIDSVHYSTAVMIVPYYEQVLDQIDLSDKYYSSEHEKELKKLLRNLGLTGWFAMENSIPLLVGSLTMEALGKLDIESLIMTASVNSKGW